MPAGDWLGYIAGAVVALSLIPQIIRVFVLRSAREISLIFNSLMLVGNLIWLAYGVYLNSIPLILWNSTGVVLMGTLLFAKLKYGRDTAEKPR